MQTTLLQACPNCGNPSPEKLSERHADLEGGFFSPSDSSVTATISVYHCKCGTTFTSSADNGDVLRKSIASSSNDDTESLLAKANRLQREIGRLVDNPSCLIVGYDGEACIAKLRAVARQCEAAGLHEAATRLNQLGRDVMRRWAE